MDIITQGLLGAVASQSIAPKNLVRSAIVIGFFSGMLADTDVLLNFSMLPVSVRRAYGNSSLLDHH